jgi:hypothetical protein
MAQLQAAARPLTASSTADVKTRSPSPPPRPLSCVLTGCAKASFSHWAHVGACLSVCCCLGLIPVMGPAVCGHHRIGGCPNFGHPGDGPVVYHHTSALGPACRWFHELHPS